MSGIMNNSSSESLPHCVANVECRLAAVTLVMVPAILEFFVVGGIFSALPHARTVLA